MQFVAMFISSGKVAQKKLREEEERLGIAPLFEKVAGTLRKVET